MKNRLTEYLIKKYNPESMIVYGSYADGTAGDESDFDALLIGGNKKLHDSSSVENVTLDVFVYPSGYFDSEYEIDEIVQIFDGDIILDKDGTATKIKAAANEYINSLPPRSDIENRENVNWCFKMMNRAARNDAEGLFRRHLVLTDSLMIYYDILRKRYFGPKKALRMMENEDPASYALYFAALGGRSLKSLENWLKHLENMLPDNTRA